MSTAAFLAFVACTTDYQQGLGDPKYAAPTGLLRPGEVDGGGPGPTDPATCTPDGGGTATCAVTFAQILETFRSCSAATGCHTTQPPIINPDDKAGTYARFTAFVVTNANSRPYVDPCSTDPAASAMACNLDPGPCGEGMPQGAVGSYDPAKLNDIRTWLQCGAPNN